MVDLSVCHPGDILFARDGRVFTFVDLFDDSVLVKYSSGVDDLSFFSLDGKANPDEDFISDADIVGLVSEGAFPFSCS